MIHKALQTSEQTLSKRRWQLGRSRAFQVLWGKGMMPISRQNSPLASDPVSEVCVSCLKPCSGRSKALQPMEQTRSIRYCQRGVSMALQAPWTVEQSSLAARTEL